MVNLEDILNAPVPISYGWTSDYRDVVTRFITAQIANKPKIIVLQNIGVYSITTNDGTTTIRKLQKVIQMPTYNAALAAALARVPAINNATILVVGHLESRTDPVSESSKQFYDKSSKYVADSAIASGTNLLESTADIERATGVTEYNDDNDTYIDPTFVLITNDKDTPGALTNASLNLGCVDIKAKRSPELSGLNETERNYVTHMISKITDKENKWQSISNIRKGIFSSSNVIKDISVVESAKDLGGYDRVKQYYTERAQYIKNETGILKINGDIFVGPPGTGRRVA